MFVTVLLVAGSLALEREENAFARVTRGLVGPSGLLAEKVALGIVASFAVTLLLLAALTALVSIDWARTPLILLAILAGGAGLRRLRRRDRRLGEGGARLLAARVHGLAADRLPLARPVRHRQRQRLTT